MKKTEIHTTQRIPTGQQVEVWFRGRERVGIGIVVSTSGTHNHNVRLDTVDNAIDGRYSVGEVYGFEIGRWSGGATLRPLNPAAVETVEYAIEADDENPF